MFTNLHLIEDRLSPLKPYKKSKNSVFRLNSINKSTDLALIKEFKRSNSNVILKQLIEKYNSYLEDKTNTFLGYCNERISREDIKSEIIIAFIEGIKKFDCERDNALVSYVDIKIKGKVLDFVLKNKFLCRISDSAANKKIIFKSNELSDDLSNELNLTKIKNKIKLSEKSIKKTLSQLINVNYSFDEFNEDDQCIGEIEYNKSFQENIFNSTSINNLIKLDRKKLIKSSLNYLYKKNPRQKEILIQIVFKNKSLEELSKTYSLSKPRISSIYKQAIRNLNNFFKDNKIELLNYF